MPKLSLETKDFLSRIDDGVTLIDSRSEDEYRHAHIPGSVNIPILNNEERIIIGTIYKEQGREQAVMKGFELVGPRFHQIIEEAVKAAPGKNVLLYCWRGGMRSNIMAWLLSTAGFSISVLKGGYKSFRKYILQFPYNNYSFIVLGGQTGSGKTEILQSLDREGHDVLDLENLASHKGSAFGGIGLPPQPSNEHFENLIGLKMSEFGTERTIWVENESRSIGSCILPESLYTHMRNAPLLNIERGLLTRVNRITSEYGNIPFKVLAETSVKLKKRLGPQHLKDALEHLDRNDFRGWLMIMIAYYDKLYQHGNSLRESDKVFNLDLTQTESDKITQTIVNFVQKYIVPSTTIAE